MYARKYVAWTRDYLQELRRINSRSGETMEILPSNLLAVVIPFRLTEPGEGCWQNDPEQRTYLISEEMLAYLILSLN